MENIKIIDWVCEYYTKTELAPLCTPARIWANPGETLQGDPQNPSDGQGGSDVEPSPWGPRSAGVTISKKDVAEDATVELLCFLCHRKDNNYAYPQFLMLFELLEFVCTPQRCSWIDSVYT